VGFRDLKMVLKVSVPTRRELQEEQNNEKQTMGMSTSVNTFWVAAYLLIFMPPKEGI